MTVRLFKSTDAGAPQLGRTDAGDLLTILRGCLVEGYGTRTPAGWTMPFSDLPNKIACFKSVTGDTLRLDDNHDYQHASGLGFKEMTDLNTGTEQYPSNDFIGNPLTHHWRLQKRYNTNSVYDAWFVVASEDWFYFVQPENQASQSYPSGFYFGKYEPSNPAQPEPYIITGHKDTIGVANVHYCYYGLYSAQEWWTRRNYQDGVLPASTWNWYDSMVFRNPNPATGHLELIQGHLRTSASPYVRLGNLCNRHVLRGGSQGGLDYRGGEKFTVDARNYIMVKYSAVCYAIEYDVEVG